MERLGDEFKYLDCRRNKGTSLNHLKFSEHLERKLLVLERELQDRSYRPGRSIVFIVEKPKIREIFAADFRDRVVHHLIYNYLSPEFERIFIYDSYACRKGRGIHRAVLRLREYLLRQQRANGQHAYYLKMDVKSFFTSISHQILYDLICKKIKREEVLWLARTIIFHDCAHDVPPKLQSRPELFARLPRDKSLFYTPRGTGLPIGNLTSQFFANVYLNELDQFVKHTLKAKYYVRYVDDLVILGEGVEQLGCHAETINQFVAERLPLAMHPRKQIIRPFADGIDFLGYIVRPDYVLVRRRVIGSWRHKMDNQLQHRESKYKSGAEPKASHIADKAKAQTIFKSYQAHAMLANSRSIVEKMRVKYRSLLP